MTATSEFLRSMITTGRVQCVCPASIREMDQHLTDCSWQRTVHEIYRLEREDENISSEVHCERGTEEGGDPDGSSAGD